MPELDLSQAVNYHYGGFPPNKIDYEAIVPKLVSATSALARYDQMLRNMHNNEILLAPLRNQEAVISSRMEGTVSTIEEIMKYEADHEENSLDSSNTRSEIIETILYRRALTGAQEALSNGYPLGTHLIKTAHQKLLSFGRGASKSPGMYKTEQNYLADKFRRNILFVPINPTQLDSGMEALVHYLSTSKHTPLIKAAVSHLEFEALHPFKDGNGRIGRMLITLLLWKEGIISAPHFYISGYLEENKDTYIDTMREVSKSGDWTPWCEFFLETIENQANRNLFVAQEIRNLYETMKSLFSDLLASKYSVQALDFIFSNPIFRNSRFTNEKISGIPSASAARFARVLAEKKIITVLEEASGRRAALYSFEKMIDLVRV